MVPRTAIGFLLAGTALYLLQPTAVSPNRRRIGQSLALLCLLLGLISAIQYLELIPALGLDKGLLAPLGREPFELRQSSHCALSFLMTGLALFLLGVKRQGQIYPLQWLAILSLAMAIMVLFGYIYGMAVFYRYTTVIGMSLPTALGFIFLSNGILLARPDQGVMRLITSDTAGGVVMRRLLPSVIIAPMAIGWLMLAGQKTGLIPEEFGVAIYGVLTMLLIIVMIVKVAVSLNREETLRRSAEEGARQYQADLAHLVRLQTLGEMVANISHELKQPLTAISLYAANSQEMLSSQDLSLEVEELHRHLAEIQAQSLRASEIIRRTREFARKQKPQTSSVQLNSLVTEVRDFLTAEARDNDVQLILELDPYLPPADVDAIQLKQVLINIVHNAIESMQTTRGGTREVTVHTRLIESGEIKVDVTDTGPGIDAETLSRVFESFFTTKGEAGMGMGLSISRSIIEAHGGRLWARSAPGQGSTFSFTLPRYQ